MLINQQKTNTCKGEYFTHNTCKFILQPPVLLTTFVLNRDVNLQGGEGRTGGGGGSYECTGTKPALIFLKRSMWVFNFFSKQEMEIESAPNNLRILLLHLIRIFFQKCLH